MRNLPPADEMAQIRDDIRRLKIREAVLRRIVLDDPALRDGLESRVVVRVQKRRSLDMAQLPAFIKNDARFWVVTETQTVLIESRGKVAHCRPLRAEGAPLNPRAEGAPPDARAAGEPVLGRKRPSAAFDWPVPDDAEVIEPF